MNEPPETDEAKQAWSVETMRMINHVTQEIRDKAFDSDWFLLRQRLEDVDKMIQRLQLVVEKDITLLRAQLNHAVAQEQAMRCEKNRVVEENAKLKAALKVK